jgi:hypothetical protein
MGIYPIGIRECSKYFYDCLIKKKEYVLIPHHTEPNDKVEINARYRVTYIA